MSDFPLFLAKNNVYPIFHFYSLKSIVQKRQKWSLWL